MNALQILCLGNKSPALSCLNALLHQALEDTQLLLAPNQKKSSYHLDRLSFPLEGDLPQKEQALLDPGFLQDKTLIHVHYSYQDQLRYLYQEACFDLTDQGKKLKNAHFLADLLKRKASPLSLSHEQALFKLFQNDRRISSFYSHCSKYIPIYFSPFYHKHFKELVKQLHLTPLENKSPFFKKKPLPILKYPKDLQKKIREYEKRRLILGNEHFLSSQAKTLIPKQKNSKAHRRFSLDLGKTSSHLLCIHAKDKNPTIFKALKNNQGCTFVFSSLSDCKEFFFNPSYRFFMEQGKLRLWHQEEYSQRLMQEMQDIRSCFYSSIDICFPPDSKLGQRIQILHQNATDKWKKNLETALSYCRKYYASDSFQKRLKAISKGKKPRIYVEQACSSVAVKRFSRNCAKTLKEMGYNTYIHPNCSCLNIDYFASCVLEIAQFLPDFVIRNPNSIDQQYFSYFPELPKLTQMQDYLPHLLSINYLKNNPPNCTDLIMPALITFKDDLIQAGVPSEQIIASYLPHEDISNFTCKATKEKDLYDVGIVKTLPNTLNLFEIMGGKKLLEHPHISHKKLRDIEELCSHIETQIACDIRADHYTSLFDRQQQDNLLVEAIARDNKLYGRLPPYEHSLKCVHYMLLLAKEGFQLSLHGKNWHNIPQLLPFSKGHIESPKDYALQFLKNKINLSSNPFVSFQSRLLAGGHLGAFFLINELPAHVDCAPLPEFFQAGKHFDTFTNSEDLIKKTHYYLNNPSLRQSLGENFKRTIQAHFSYKNLCTMIMERYTFLLQKKFSLKK